MHHAPRRASAPVLWRCVCREWLDTLPTPGRGVVGCPGSQPMDQRHRAALDDLDPGSVEAAAESPGPKERSSMARSPGDPGPRRHEELWREHLLTRPQATRLQEAVLASTGAEGGWL